jgi:hypothetical protein
MKVELIYLERAGDPMTGTDARKLAGVRLVWSQLLGASTVGSSVHS